MFTMRKRGQATVGMTIFRDDAVHLPEALRHVGKQVFESDDKARYHLRDAARAVEEALNAQEGNQILVSLTNWEIVEAISALAHVRREVFFDDTPGDRELLEAFRRMEDILEENAPVPNLIGARM